MCTFFLEVFPSTLLAIFTSGPALIEFCIVPLQVFLALTPLAALPMLTGTYFQSVGRPGEALVVSLARPLFLVSLALLLPAYGASTVS